MIDPVHPAAMEAGWKGRLLEVRQRVAPIQMNIAMGQTYATTKPRVIALARAMAAKLG